jgi:Domain of unknown function (DUF4926)
VKFSEIDVVELTEDVGGFAYGERANEVVELKCGEIGTVVCAFTVPHEAYEVEFVRDGGHDSDFATVRPEQLRLVKSYTAPHHTQGEPK